MKFVESEMMTRCVSVGCDENDRPMEKRITYKFPWDDMERIAAAFDIDANVHFKYVTTTRYKRQWSYFGTYLIGQIGIKCWSQSGSLEYRYRSRKQDDQRKAKTPMIKNLP